MGATSSVFAAAKLLIPLDVEVEISLRYTRSDDVESCLEILVEHRPHLDIYVQNFGGIFGWYCFGAALVD